MQPRWQLLLGTVPWINYIHFRNYLWFSIFHTTQLVRRFREATLISMYVHINIKVDHVVGALWTSHYCIVFNTRRTPKASGLGCFPIIFHTELKIFVNNIFFKVKWVWKCKERINRLDMTILQKNCVRACWRKLDHRETTVRMGPNFFAFY